jgi:hypothetical protein
MGDGAQRRSSFSALPDAGLSKEGYLSKRAIKVQS